MDPYIFVLEENTPQKYINILVKVATILKVPKANRMPYPQSLYLTFFTKILKKYIYFNTLTSSYGFLWRKPFLKFKPLHARALFCIDPQERFDSVNIYYNV